jgi:hypothetical protein
MSSVPNPVFLAQNPWSAPVPSAPISASLPTGTSGAAPATNPFLFGNTSSNPYVFGNLLPIDSSPYGAPAVPGGGGTTTPAPPFSTTSTGSGATGVSSMGANLGVPTTGGGQDKLLQTLNKAFGAGIGTSLYNFLAGGAGFNQQAINNLIAAMQPGFQQAQQDLMQQFSAGGNRFGSGAELGLSNLQSQQQLDIGQLETQMYEQSVQNYLDVLMGAGGTRAQQKQSGTQDLLSVLNNLISGGSNIAAAAAAA